MKYFGRVLLASAVAVPLSALARPETRRPLGSLGPRGLHGTRLPGDCDQVDTAAAEHKTGSLSRGPRRKPRRRMAEADEKGARHPPPLDDRASITFAARDPQKVGSCALKLEKVAISLFVVCGCWRVPYRGIGRERSEERGGWDERGRERQGGGGGGGW